MAGTTVQTYGGAAAWRIETHTHSHTRGATIYPPPKRLFHFIYANLPPSVGGG